MTLTLLISSTAALVLLVVHSWRTRGRTVTLAFFIAATLFGLLRGNAIWLLCKALGGTTEVLMPYVPQGGLLPGVAHASIQVALGWVFALYLAWTAAELILRRLPRFTGRMFMIAGLASLFMLAICYAMETTAVKVGWWYWQLPTRSLLFGNVNSWAMEGWFSVVPDFLIPFLVIVCADTRRRLKWLWVLVFPLHLLGHLSFQWFRHAFLVYPAMELLVIVLMMFVALRMVRGEIVEAADGRRSVVQMLPGLSLVIFFGVLVTANVVSGGGTADQLTLLPMGMLCLLAWRRVPVAWVAVLSLAGAAGWWWIGARAFWVLVPVGVYGFLRLHERLGESVQMKLVPAVVQVALTLWVVVLFQRDTARIDGYVRAWVEGERLALAGRSDAAAEAYRRADGLRPEDPDRLYQTLQRMAGTPAEDPQQSVRLFQYRMPRLVRELEEVIRRDPEWAEPRITLARFQLLLGNLASATEQYRIMHRCRPRHTGIMTMLAYLLLRQGEFTEPEKLCTAAVQRDAPAAALVNLGVIHWCRKQDDEARGLWMRALRKAPGDVTARLNLERLEGPVPDREIDLRYLAQPSKNTPAAVWANALAVHGDRYSVDDRLRLWLEATGFDPDYLLSHMNLVSNVYLGRVRPLRDGERALWHARRAVEIARASADRRLPDCLLLLGEALLANGKQGEARKVLEEGRSRVDESRKAEFDRLLDRP